MTVYEDAGEATIWRESPGGDPDENLARVDDGTPEDRAAANRERCVRRAKKRARVYAATNRTTTLVSFTYRPGRPCVECGAVRPVRDCGPCRRRVKADWHLFARRLIAAGHRIAWLRAVEAHKDGSAHVHAAMTGSWDSERRTRFLAGLWGQGYVDARRFTSGQAGTAREQARRAAAYVVKYAVKEIETGLLDPGEHAYEVAEGFQPVATRLRAWTRLQGVSAAIETMGGSQPSYQWQSDESQTWIGPPVTFLGW